MFRLDHEVEFGTLPGLATLELLDCAQRYEAPEGDPYRLERRGAVSGVVVVDAPADGQAHCIAAIEVATGFAGVVDRTVECSVRHADE
ncbi:hypothetical protein [Microbacterium aoyamense]|uniref:hypothetical protein n=1 Tax=Microbacterium aoyamense TaxID=344166 RepID=UPI0020050A20|nr:hypothetical protein [Microbacterium aoyamense]